MFYSYIYQIKHLNVISISVLVLVWDKDVHFYPFCSNEYRKTYLGCRYSPGWTFYLCIWWLWRFSPHHKFPSTQFWSYVSVVCYRWCPVWTRTNPYISIHTNSRILSKVPGTHIRCADSSKSIWFLNRPLHLENEFISITFCFVPFCIVIHPCNKNLPVHSTCVHVRHVVWTGTRECRLITEFNDDWMAYILI